MQGLGGYADSDASSGAGNSWILGAGGRQLEDCVLLSGGDFLDGGPQLGPAGGGRPWSPGGSGVVHLSEGELEAGSEADEDFAGFLHGGGGSQAGYYGGSVGNASDGGAAGDDDVCILDGQWGGAPSSSGNRLQETLDDISAPGSAESSPRGALAMERTQGHASASGLRGGPWHFAAPRRDAMIDRPVADHASDEAKVVRFEALLRARERTIKEQGEEIAALQSQLADTSGERDHLAQSRGEWKASSEQLGAERARLEGELARATSTVGALQAQGRDLEEALAADKLSIDELQVRVWILGLGVWGFGGGV